MSPHCSISPDPKPNPKPRRAVIHSQTRLHFEDVNFLPQNAINTSRDHFRMEEQVVFPLLTKVLQHETLTELGRLWGDRNYEMGMATDAA